METFSGKRKMNPEGSITHQSREQGNDTGKDEYLGTGKEF